MKDVGLPEVGQRISYRKKGESGYRQGVVTCVWAYEEAIIDVDGTSIIPAFGDDWQNYTGRMKP
jgi:hypothetical protein